MKIKLFYKKLLTIFMCIFLLIGLCGCQLVGSTEEESIKGKEGDFKVHFLDVGQADCTIIQSGKEAMIIDAGNNGDADYILSYLDSLGVSTLQYAIATHSHEDHVGSMDRVISHIKVEQIIIPEEETSTITYQDVLNAIKSENVKVIRPAVGTEYKMGNASFQIIAPSDTSYSDTNDYSVGVIVKYGKHKFMFTGDASEKSEKEIMKTGIDLEVDVLQAGHHGSSTANSETFLKKADPVYVVISCGKDNKYGHPHVETLTRLEENDIQVYRTDQQGTMIASSDGKEIHWEVGKSIAIEDYKKEENKLKQTYILNTSSKKVHTTSCSGIDQIKEENKKKVKDTSENLIKEGYEACKKCKPF